MTVGELREALKNHPADLKVVTPLWSDLADLEPVAQIKVIKSYDSAWYEKYHPEQHEGMPRGTINVLLIQPKYPGRKI